MGLYHPLFAIAAFAAALVVAWGVSWVVPLFRQLTRPEKSRFLALDGFRGFLALGVFVHHSSIYYVYLQSGTWELPPSSLYQFLGRGCVAYFFMITGFLFWNKGLANRKSVAYPRLIKGRIRRLMPLYLFTYLVLLLLTGVATRFQLHEPAWQVAWEVTKGSLGGFFGMPAVNQFETGHINAGVTWSLRYEWLFYACLPILIFCIGEWRRLAIACAVFLGLGIAVSLNPHLPNAIWVIYALNFLAGMSAAQIHTLLPESKVLRSKAFGWGSLVLAGVVAAFWQELPDAAKLVGLWPLFLAVIYGFSMAGVFRARPAVLLGHISYSVYLLHGIVLYLYFGIACRYVSFVGIPPVNYWAQCIALAAPLVMIASVTFRFIEYPFMTPKAVKAAAPARQDLEGRSGQSPIFLERK